MRCDKRLKTFKQIFCCWFVNMRVNLANTHLLRFIMLFHLNITLQRSIIFSWYLAWMLITAMPVIHAHSATLSNQSNHCPVASMQLFNETDAGLSASMHHNMPVADDPNAASNEPTPFYHCPLCHCGYLLFTHELSIFVTPNSSSSVNIPYPDAFHFLAVLFKPARSPPLLLSWFINHKNSF